MISPSQTGLIRVLAGGFSGKTKTYPLHRVANIGGIEEYLCPPTAEQQKVQSFHSIMEEETTLLMKKIRESTDPVNLSEMFTELTNDIVDQLFGRMYSKGESGKKFLSLLREFLEELTTISIGDFVPCLSWINRVNGFDSRVDKLSKEVDEFLEGVIRECLETPEELVAANTAIILEPEKFHPDRFLNSSTDFKSLDFELLPFGAGSRGCPGMAFAMATNEFVLANLVQKFDWKLPDEGKDLDMSERSGGVIRRAVPRLAMGTQYHS